MEVKKTGKYITKDNQEVEIYGFDSLGGNEVLAEGYFVKTKNMAWWNPETGECVIPKSENNNIIKKIK